MNNYLKEKEWLLREKYGGQKTDEFLKDMERLESGEPIDYLIGFFDFLGCRIDLSFRPLIPRTETEWWVEQVINIIAEGRCPMGVVPPSECLETPMIPIFKSGDGAGADNGLPSVDDNPRPATENFGHPMSKIKILDLFAGSGCIGIALLKHLPNATVDFGEKESGFVTQIEKNIALNEVKERAQVFMSDVFTNIPAKKYDFIFANPPYISRTKIEAVQKSVLDHEPSGALFAEDDGLFYIKKLLTKAPQFLAPNGKLFTEFDSWQKDEIEKLAALSPFHAEFWKDQFDRWRVIVCSL